MVTHFKRGQKGINGHARIGYGLIKKENRGQRPMATVFNGGKYVFLHVNLSSSRLGWNPSKTFVAYMPTTST